MEHSSRTSVSCCRREPGGIWGIREVSGSGLCGESEVPPVQNASLWLELASWQTCCYSDPLTRYCFKYT